MAHTYTNLLFHVVFSTKDRQSLIIGELRHQLYAYMASLIKEKTGKPFIINGIADHVHLLFALPPNVCLSDVMRFVKANSSRWAAERFDSGFAWQKGFGAFSVSRSAVDAVSKYIRDQEIHHRTMDFRSEFKTLLDRNDVEYDER